MLKGADRTAVDAHAAALFEAYDDDDENSVTNDPETVQNRGAPGRVHRGHHFASRGL